MKIKMTSNHKTTLCQFKHVLITSVAAVGLALIGSVQAQPVTGTLILSNIPPAMTAVYPDWSAAANSDTATGFEVSATDLNGGAGYYSIPVANQQVINVNATQAVLTVTINDGNTQSSVWVGMGFYLNDNVGSYQVGGYVGEYGYYGQFSPGADTWDVAGTTVTETVQLPAAMLATIQAGGDTINGITLEYYPAVYTGSGYNVTFDSLVLQPVAGPAALAITSSQYNSATSQFTLSWASQANAQYTVQFSPDLVSGFTSLVSNISSGGATTTNTVTVPAGNAGYFRILQQ